MSLIDMTNDIKTEHADKTADELNVWCAENPTGSIVVQKARFRAVKEKAAEEKQAAADSLLNLKDYPKSEAGFGSDSFGDFVKIYLDGKAEVNLDGI